jgi:hypothetical protein
MNGSPTTTSRHKALRSGALALALSLMPAATAHALDLQVPSAGGAALRNDAGELRALENRLQRQRYQERQQRFREEERLSIQPRRQLPQVPVVRPGCRMQVYGNIQSCR